MEDTAAAGVATGVAAPSRVLTAAARQFVSAGGAPYSTPRPLAGASLSMRDPALGDEADCPVPHLRPLAGKFGVVNPGAQYWAPNHDMGRYSAEDMVSEHMAHFWKRPETGAQLAKSLPFTDTRHGMGTGYCPNHVSVNDVAWRHKDEVDTFRTTYNDFHGKGHLEPRASMAAHVQAATEPPARGTVPFSARTRRRTDHLGL